LFLLSVVLLRSHQKPTAVQNSKVPQKEACLRPLKWQIRESHVTREEAPNTPHVHVGFVDHNVSEFRQCEEGCRPFKFGRMMAA
jgi:hypothetical protein